MQILVQCIYTGVDSLTRVHTKTDALGLKIKTFELLTTCNLLCHDSDRT